jgi:hypothetical protein
MEPAKLKNQKYRLIEMCDAPAETRSVDLDHIILEYEETFSDFFELGWDAYILNVKFAPMNGYKGEKVLEMARGVAEMYGTLVGQALGGKKNTPKLLQFVPVGVFFPRLMSRVERNMAARNDVPFDEFRMSGMVFTSRRKKLTKSLDEHFKVHKQSLIADKIGDIRVKRLQEEELEGEVKRLFDGLEDRLFTSDDITILDAARRVKRMSYRPDFENCCGYDAIECFNYERASGLPVFR